MLNSVVQNKFIVLVVRFKVGPELLFELIQLVFRSVEQLHYVRTIEFGTDFLRFFEIVLNFLDFLVELVISFEKVEHEIQVISSNWLRLANFVACRQVEAEFLEQLQKFAWAFHLCLHKVLIIEEMAARKEFAQLILGFE